MISAFSMLSALVMGSGAMSTPEPAILHLALQRDRFYSVSVNINETESVRMAFAPCTNANFLPPSFFKAEGESLQRFTVRIKTESGSMEVKEVPFAQANLFTHISRIDGIIGFQFLKEIAVERSLWRSELIFYSEPEMSVETVDNVFEHRFDVKSFPIEMNKFGLPTVRLKYAGKTYRLAIDYGTVDSLVRVDRKHSNEVVSGLSSGILGYFTEVPIAKDTYVLRRDSNDSKLPPLYCYYVSDDVLIAPFSDCDGILSLSAFPFDSIADFKGSVLYLMIPKSPEERLRYLLKAYLRITVDYEDGKWLLADAEGMTVPKPKREITAICDTPMKTIFESAKKGGKEEEGFITSFQKAAHNGTVTLDFKSARGKR